MNRVPTTLQGLPDDLLDSDHPYFRNLKVSVKNLEEIQVNLLSTFSDLMQSNQNIEKQLKLLNLRIEEGFETKIQESDANG